MKFLLFCVKVGRGALVIILFLFCIIGVALGGVFAIFLVPVVTLPLFKWLEGLLIDAEVYLESR